MAIRSLLLASSLVVAACSAPLGTGGGGGTGLTGGAGTTGGSGDGIDAGPAGGSGGHGGAGGLAACMYSSFSPGAFVEDEAGNQTRTSFMVAVTVVSSDDCASGTCDSNYTGARRIVLAEAGGRRWTLYAYFSGLPADIVAVGDALDLGAAYREVQTGVGSAFFSSTVLSRAGTAVIFDVSAAADLAPYGITVTSSAVGLCMTDVCYTSAGADVTYGAETRSASPGQTVNIGKLSFSHGGFNTRVGPCDWVEHVESMAGFTAR
jgi:hypothetical protein